MFIKVMGAKVLLDIDCTGGINANSYITGSTSYSFQNAYRMWILSSIFKQNGKSVREEEVGRLFSRANEVAA